jgi:hypothetical protein
MGGVCGMHGIEKKCINILVKKSMEERDYLEDLGVDGRYNLIGP